MIIIFVEFIDQLIGYPINCASLSSYISSLSNLLPKRGEVLPHGYLVECCRCLRPWAQIILEFTIAPETLYERSWTGPMLFSMDCSAL